uniref:Uncharacterized protein n=1 Tax=Lepeophtheirus salmonis TaxID=72036 RepID=A0A0K2T123_LEPSM
MFYDVIFYIILNYIVCSF